MKKNKFASIQEIIKEAQKGKMFILVDDENRENEGDLVIPALNISAKSINFMAKYGRGLICLALDSRQAKKLNLSLMSPVNKSRMQTAFTVSIEAKKGVTTGISAIDRSHTIKTAIRKNVKKARSQYDKAQRIIKKYAIKLFEFKFSIIADTLNSIENRIEVNDLISTRTTLEPYDKETFYVEWW